LRLNAEVTFPGARFIISNNDSFDWRNVKLEIMPESTEYRFSLRVPNISAGEICKATAVEFSKKAGSASIHIGSRGYFAQYPELSSRLESKLSLKALEINLRF